jgi:hypothetical protein
VADNGNSNKKPTTSIIDGACSCSGCPRSRKLDARRGRGAFTNCKGDEDIDANRSRPSIRKPVMGHAKKERVLLFGTHQRITSGPAAKRRTQRPNTWPLIVRILLHPLAAAQHFSQSKGQLTACVDSSRAPGRSNIARRAAEHSGIVSGRDAATSSRTQSLPHIDDHIPSRCYHKAIQRI